MKIKQEKEMKRKGGFLFLVFIFGLILLIGQLTYIVLVEGKNYNLAVLQNATKREESLTLKDERGQILDRNGIVLAESVSTYDLIFDAKLLTALSQETQDKTILFLRDSLKFDEVELRDILLEKAMSNYVVIGKGYSYTDFKEVKTAIDGYLIKGLFYSEAYERSYPYPKLASDVIGFVDSDLNGKLGIELQYDTYLKGDVGRIYGSIGDDKKLEVQEIDAVNGANVMLTLDYTVQKHIDEAIVNYLETDAATRIHVIVMNPNNGEIYGMANYPDYDLSKPYDAASFKELEQFLELSDSDILNHLWNNENITDSYEPGSTFKPFVMAAALEENKVTSEETYNCTGSLRVANYTIRCWKDGGHGEQTIEQALENSCNVAFMEIGAALGRDTFYKYQHMFGFGAQTGIDLAGETAVRKNVYTLEGLNQVELATSSFGQGFNVSPIQLITAFSSVINGGYLYQPHLMKKIYTEDQVIETSNTNLYRQVISKEVSKITRLALGNVVNEGTGKKASIAGYEIGGKTGTAETNARDDLHYIVSFIGFAPIEDPQVITLVVVDDPKGFEVNSRFAAKIFVDVMEDVMPYLHIFKAESIGEEVVEPVQTETGSPAIGGTGNTTTEGENTQEPITNE